MQRKEIVNTNQYKKMPKEIKQTIGEYLIDEKKYQNLKEKIMPMNPQDTFINQEIKELSEEQYKESKEKLKTKEKELHFAGLELLNNRLNMQLAYPDRTGEECLKYTTAPWKWMCHSDPALSSDEQDDNAMCKTLFCFSCVLATSIFGFFVDTARYAKRKCNDASDQKLHELIVGLSPISQEMK